MALATPALKTALEALFVAPDINPTALAEQWRVVMAAWAATVAPVTTASTAAAAALKTTLISIFSTTGTASAKGGAMDTAFQTFAAAIGVGMAPTFTGVPPASPPGFVATLAPPFSETHNAAATKWGDLFDVWFKTGTATLVAPPNTVVPWT